MNSSSNTIAIPDIRLPIQFIVTALLLFVVAQDSSITIVTEYAIPLLVSTDIMEWVFLMGEHKIGQE